VVEKPVVIGIGGDVGALIRVRAQVEDFRKLTTAGALSVLFGPALPILKQAQAQAYLLPSWNDGPSNRAITDFVARVTQQGGPDFVPPAERIATFDNDGTLWVEHPMYTQLAFALDRLKAMVPLHPEWKETQPFKAALEGDMKTLGAITGQPNWSWRPMPT
jgi:hypothetical protein